MTSLEQIAYGVLATIIILVAGTGLIWAVVNLLVLWATRPELIKSRDEERLNQLRWAQRVGKPQEEIDLLRKVWKM